MTEQQGISNAKAQKLQSYFQEAGIDCFGVQETGDELQTVLFRTELAVGGQTLPLLLFTDNSLYSMIKVRVAAAAVKAENRQTVLDCLNEQNRQYKLFKYAVSNEQDVVLDICLPAAPETFDPQLVPITIDLALRHLNEFYPVLMRTIWG